jgi:aspartate aminotransferase
MPLYEENGFSFSAEEVLSPDHRQPRLIIINSPANPTGGLVPREEMDKLAEGLPRSSDVCVMSDEIYSRMLYDGREHVSMLEYEHLRDRVIMLDGWSKTYAMTGWRLGFAVWPDGLVDHATRWPSTAIPASTHRPNGPGKAALEGPQDAVDMMMAAFAERRKVIVSELNQVARLPLYRAGRRVLRLPEHRRHGDVGAKKLQDELLEKTGVAIIAGTSFGAMGEGYVRFSYANSTENIREAIRRVREYLGNK